MEVGGFAFVAQGQAPVSGQPGDRAFDDSSVLAQCVAGVDAFAGDTGDDSTVPEPGAESGDVVGLVGMQLGGFTAPWSATGADGGKRVDQWFECLAVAGVGRGNIHDEGQAGTVGQDMDFRAGFAAVNWVRPGQGAPFFFCPDGRSVQNRAGPVDQPLAAQFIQHRLVQPPPQPGHGPLGEGPMCRRHRHPERGRQVPPGAAAGQHEHDRGEHRPRTRPRTPTTLRTHLRRRDQRLHQSPQLIRHQPSRQRVPHKPRASQTAE